jgi:hypothetical protein
VIGIEREWHHPYEGLRINVLVALGSAGFVLCCHLVTGDDSGHPLACFRGRHAGRIRRHRQCGAAHRLRAGGQPRAAPARDAAAATLERIPAELAQAHPIASARWRVEMASE